MVATLVGSDRGTVPSLRLTCGVCRESRPGVTWLLKNRSLPGVTREVEWLGLGLVEWLLKNQSFPGVRLRSED